MDHSERRHGGRGGGGEGWGAMQMLNFPGIFFLFLFVGRNGFECYEFPVCVWMWMSVCMRVCAY